MHGFGLGACPLSFLRFQLERHSTTYAGQFVLGALLGLSDRLVRVSKDSPVSLPDLLG